MGTGAAGKAVQWQRPGAAVMGRQGTPTWTQEAKLSVKLGSTGNCRNTRGNVEIPCTRKAGQTHLGTGDWGKTEGKAEGNREL